MIQIAAVVLVALVLVGVVAVFAMHRRSTGMVDALSTPSLEAPRTASDPLGRVIGALRTRRWARWSLSGASLAMLLVAVGLLGYPFYTNLQQERRQQELRRELVSPKLEQAYKARSVGTGDALTRIKIPSISVDTVVVEGTTQSALRAGAGHYPNSPLPCETGNVAIAGHRTTYGKPFHNLDLLHPGDTIVLETPIGSCTYKIVGAPFVVTPTDTSVLNPTPVPSLTLTTCHPKGSARQRLIVRAELVGEAVAV